MHQSKLHPAQNKFHLGNGQDQKHYWLTPPSMYEALNDEFQFDFDPCPHPLPEGFDGLTCDWGKSNYVNPPFGSIIHQGRKKGPTAWVRKAIAEHAKGKTVVLVYPVDKWVLMLLKATGSQVRNLGDVRWNAIEDGTPGNGTGRHIACFVLQAMPAVSKPRLCDLCETRIVHGVDLAEIENREGGPHVQLHTRCWRDIGAPLTLKQYRDIRQGESIR